MMRSIIVLLAGALALAARAADQVPLHLDLPKPLFVGTPRPIELPNLEKPRVGRRPDLMVPAGTILLSKGMPVTGSDSEPVIGELSFVTDGDKTGVDGAFVQFGPGTQWVQLDLGKPAALQAIVVWHFHAQARVYHDVVVQVSNDAAFSTGVQTLFNNDLKNAVGRGAGTDPAYVETYEGRLIPANGVHARYVRLYSNGNTTDELNDYCEVEVYGQPLP